LDIDPRDVRALVQLATYGAEFLQERDEEVLTWQRLAAATSPQVPTILAGLTSELALTGHDTEARARGWSNTSRWKTSAPGRLSNETIARRRRRVFEISPAV
jgi:hypothetical protein